MILEHNFLYLIGYFRSVGDKYINLFNLQSLHYNISAIILHCYIFTFVLLGPIFKL